MNAREYMARVHELPCVVCTHLGQEQDTRTCAHHVESVRDEDSHYASIAICEDHHRLLHHLSRRGFLMLTKLTDVDMLALTIKAWAKEISCST